MRLGNCAVVTTAIARRSSRRAEVIMNDASPTVTCDTDFLNTTPDPRIGAVICGCDFSLSFSKICYASLCLQLNPGCLFLATSEDSFDTFKDRRIPAMTGKRVGWFARRRLPWPIRLILAGQRCCAVSSRQQACRR